MKSIEAKIRILSKTFFLLNYTDFDCEEIYFISIHLQLHEGQPIYFVSTRNFMKQHSTYA